MSSPEALSISALTRLITHTLEQNPSLQQADVVGEVSNLTYHRSGHVYLTLKDSEAALSAVMFKGDLARNGGFRPREGDQVRAQGRISVYAARGSYQMILSRMQPAGAGALYQLFLERKQALEAEGLFDPAKRRSLPRFPRSIAVITSPTGAVIRDIQQTLARRFPAVRVWLLPAQVQGAGATPSLVAALAQVPALQRAVGLQAVVVARGGGSLEDLWCFNEPDLVRAVSACPVPVVSAVGHETDTTLCDLAADHRAPTPTAAAEILTPNASELLSQLRATLPWLADRSLRRLQDTHQRLDTQQDRLLRPLQQRLQAAHHTLGSGQQQLRHAAFQALRAHVHQLDLTARTIEALDPRQILDRGYTLTYQKGRLLRRQADLDTAMPIQTHWADGQADSQPL